MTMTTEQQKRNRRLAWILASVVIVFFLGFMARAALWGI
jgi:hypothetical protein